MAVDTGSPMDQAANAMDGLAEDALNKYLDGLDEGMQKIWLAGRISLPASQQAPEHYSTSTLSPTQSQGEEIQALKDQLRALGCQVEILWSLLPKKNQPRLEVGDADV